MAVNSQMVELGTPAPDFALPSVTDGATVTLDSLRGSPALLVVFLSNHCPYVKHLEKQLGAFAAEYAERGLTTVGISANDVANYPDDAPARLAEQRERAGFTFPYLYDESQEVALAYRAACTPDFFLYDAQGRLAYRGQFDDTRPKGTDAPTGDSMRAAVDAVLAGRPVPEPHYPSIGCSIKWKPGNEPE